MVLTPVMFAGSSGHSENSLEEDESDPRHQLAKNRRNDARSVGCGSQGEKLQLYHLVS